MSVDHPKTAAWEDRLRNIFFTVDDYLEDKYGDCFPLHPNRPPRGATSNSEMDGLFNVGASFTAGFGSKRGRGWVVEIHLATLAWVPEETRNEIKEDTKRLLQKELALRFPERKLHVEEDGTGLKIFGDLSLGEL